MTDETKQIVQEDKPIAVTLRNGSIVHLRPLNMDDLLSDGVAEDLGLIVAEINRSYESLKAQAKLNPLTVDFTADLILAAFIKIRPVMRRMLALLMDRPLAVVQIDDVPAVLEAMIAANFAEDRLRPWVGLLAKITPAISQTKAPTSTTSGTSSTPSSSAVTITGEAIPPINSSSGSGDASGASADTAPT